MEDKGLSPKMFQWCGRLGVDSRLHKYKSEGTSGLKGQQLICITACQRELAHLFYQSRPEVYEGQNGRFLDG